MEVFDAIHNSRTCMAMCKMTIAGQYDDAAYCLDAPNDIAAGSSVHIPTTTNDEGVFAATSYVCRPGWAPPNIGDHQIKIHLPGVGVRRVTYIEFHVQD